MEVYLSIIRIPLNAVSRKSIFKSASKNKWPKVISPEVSEADLMDLKNYGIPFHNHNYRCSKKCTAEHKNECGVHKYKNIQRRFRTGSIRTALKV